MLEHGDIVKGRTELWSSSWFLLQLSLGDCVLGWPSQVSKQQAFQEGGSLPRWVACIPSGSFKTVKTGSMGKSEKIPSTHTKSCATKQLLSSLIAVTTRRLTWAWLWENIKSNTLMG